jgi:hypothetical protein
MDLPVDEELSLDPHGAGLEERDESAGRHPKRFIIDP